MKKFILFGISLFLLIILIIIIKGSSKNSDSGNEFYTFIGQTQDNLHTAVGKPDNVSSTGTMLAYQYISGNKNIVYGIKNGEIVTAIKGIKHNSLDEARDEKAEQILFYMALGFTKQGSESGMTILRGNNRVLNIGFMANDDGSYSTLISAF